MCYIKDSMVASFFSVISDVHHGHARNYLLSYFSDPFITLAYKSKLAWNNTVRVLVRTTLFVYMIGHNIVFRPSLWTSEVHSCNLTLHIYLFTYGYN